MPVEVKTNMPGKLSSNGYDIYIKREPVESSDSTVDTEKLSAIFENCKISSSECQSFKEEIKQEDVAEKEICSKLSKVTLKEKNDDGKDIEVIVENIKKEDECGEKKRALGSNGLVTRGPAGGIPATFTQSQHSVQAQYQNGYSYSQSMPYFQQPQQNQYGGYDNNQYVNNMTNGKRRPEEDDETPYKYQAPNIVREGMNNLNIPLNIQPENVTNQCHMSGGMMSVQNTFMVQKTKVQFPPYVPTDDNDDLSNFGNSLTDENVYQNFTSPPFTQMQTPHSDSVSTDYLQDGGSEGYGSPGHESQYSTMGIDSPPPHSNLSDDSGISSPDHRNLDAASPSSNMSVNSGSPRSNVYAPNLGMPQQYTNTDSMSCDQTTHFSNYQTTEVNSQPSELDWEDEGMKDMLKDALDVVAKDLMEINRSKEMRKRQTSGSQMKSLNSNLKDNLAINPNNNLINVTNTTPQTSSNVIRPVNANNNKPANLPSVKPQAPVNNSQVVIQAAPVSMGTPAVSVTLAPVSVMPNTKPNTVMSGVPVTTGQILLIAPSTQPLFVVNQPVKINTQCNPKRPTKPTYVPIRPKLDPVSPKKSPQSSPANSPKGCDLKSQIPATVTAAVKNNKPVQPVTNTKTPSKTTSTCTTTTSNSSGKSTTLSSNRLNLARRAVADLTSNALRFQDEDEGNTYLHVAVCKADIYFVQALLERLEREKLIGMIDVTNLRRQTTLYCAVCTNKADIVEMLIKHGADVNTLAERMVQGGTVREVRAAVHVAASNGKEYLETLNALLKSKELNLNIANSDGQTALHCAILCHNKAKQDSTDCIDSTPIIETLIQHGADINAQVHLSSFIINGVGWPNG
ncbi:NF-kappa-B inhibitor zeta [Patella vulgata]|uniref:NF-kappa-B inhibitor zeta n=1 Tax=Patella vulgata TaxID=6465 RepID=UPI0024A809B8|nr:NF-kappa-B inhibitor zeta [Patella vulgata]